MVKIRKNVIISIVAISLVLNFLINTKAIYSNKYTKIETIEVTELPESFKFTISEVCTDHAFFEQATARRDGYYAICTSGVVVDRIRSDTNKKFIDLYNSENEFILEIAFEVSSDIAIEFTDSTLNIYLYSGIICYNVDSQEVVYYITPEYEAYNSGLVDDLRKEEFTVGEWTYTYDNNFIGYSKLMRTNGTEKQILVEMEGINSSDSYGNIVCLISGILFSMFGIVWFLKNRTNQNQSGDKTGDGFVSRSEQF